MAQNALFLDVTNCFVLTFETVLQLPFDPNYLTMTEDDNP